MAQASYTFELRAGSYGESDLSVDRFLGSEAISELFAMEVDFFPDSGKSIDLEGLCTTEACLTVRRSDGKERFFHGVVTSVRLLGTPEGSPRYRLVISPKAALLGCGKKSRTFLDQTVPEVVKQLLDGGRIEQRWKLRGAAPWYSPERCYRKKECIAQYVESDLTCFMRLLEREGAFFLFAQSSSGHEMVVGDGAHAFEQVEEPLPFRTRETANWRTDYLYELSRRTHRVPKRVVLRDYDFENPQLDLTCIAGADKCDPTDEVYEHAGGYTDLEDGKRLVQIRLEEQQFGAETWTGRAESMQLAAGRVFEVIEHPDHEWCQKLLAVRVTHQGSQQRGAAGVVEGSYQCGFLAITASRPYRPRRQTPRPRIDGYQSATVVGPEGEEIETDQYGRVRLAFHWNGSQGEEPQSGWVRVRQALAGPGYGTLFIPRVGQEVLVSYQGGDPERPVVLNAAYHGEHRAPVKLPHDKTRTALRTDSSPSSSGYGYNELYFEDTAGQEEIHLRAQRDELIEVLNDKTQQVSGSEKLTVQKDRSQKVGGNQSLKVGGDDQAEVRGSQTLAVAKDRTVTVGADHSETVGALKTVKVAQEQTVRVAQAAAVTVGGGADLNVGGGYSVNAGVDLNIAVGGARLEEVGGLKAEVVGLHREERVAGDKSLTVKGEAKVQVHGSVIRSTGGDQEEIAESIRITAAEEARLRAKGVRLKATEQLTIRVGGEVALEMFKSGEIRIFGKTVSIEGSAIKLRGGQIQKIGPGTGKQEKAEAKRLEELRLARAKVELTLVDLDAAPIVSQLFRVEMEDGSLRKGATDAQGHVVMPAPKEGKFQVTFEGEPPTSWTPKLKGKAQGALRVELGKAYSLTTGKNHLLELPVKRNVMTLAFVSRPQSEGSYPKYVLESEDGEYRVERTAQDLVRAGQFFELRFDQLKPDKRYQLTRWGNAGASEVIFKGAGYGDINDQMRHHVVQQIETVDFVTGKKSKPGRTGR